MYAVDQTDFTLGCEVGKQVYAEVPHLEPWGVSNVAGHRYEDASKSMTLDRRLFERGVRFGYLQAKKEAKQAEKERKV